MYAKINSSIMAELKKRSMRIAEIENTLYKLSRTPKKDTWQLCSLCKASLACKNETVYGLQCRFNKWKIASKDLLREVFNRLIKFVKGGFYG